jgi:transcriptional regulator with XRE-family HTH domain
MAVLKERLRELRKFNKLTQKDVAQFLGVSESAYGYYEQGRNEPSLEALKKLADKYNVSLSYLMGEPDDDFELSPKEQVFFKEFHKLNEEDKKKALEHIKFLRHLAEQENNK